MSTGDRSASHAWRARLVDLGPSRVVILITAFSVVAAVAVTYGLVLLEGQGPDERLSAVIIAAAAALMIAPLASYGVVQLLFELEKAQARLFTMATRDNLTRVYNRHFFMARLESSTSAQLEQVGPLSLLMIDADDFKAINDHHGHAEGDRTLQEIARACESALRPVDILARYGGEEFTALLPDTDLGAACEVAERVRAAVATLRVVGANGATIAVTVSIGVSTYSPNDVGFGTLLHRADAALYEAKRGGRNRWAPAHDLKGGSEVA